LLTWDVKEVRPMRGLALGYSRTNVHNAFQRWGLTNAGVVPNTGLADTELVLSTGHAAKGAEADDVYLLPWSRVAMDRLEQRDPETLRLLYVMLTRARRRVFVPRALRARLPL
jgi:superfamily I DNA/RNA helicase